MATDIFSPKKNEKGRNLFNSAVICNNSVKCKYSFNVEKQFYLKALSGATTPGQSGPGSDVNEEVLHIPQSSSTAGTSPSDCLVSYPGHSLGGVLPLCREAVGVFYSPSRLGN